MTAGGGAWGWIWAPPRPKAPVEGGAGTGAWGMEGTGSASEGGGYTEPRCFWKDAGCTSSAA